MSDHEEHRILATDIEAGDIVRAPVTGELRAAQAVSWASDCSVVAVTGNQRGILYPPHAFVTVRRARA